MSLLNGKRIVLAITGSIAAYKSAILVRLLKKAGCEVQVLMTEAAKAFISPLTLSTLSGRQVYSQIFDADQWNSHVELGLWGDVFLIAPMTANTLAKCAHGLADSLVAATYLSSRCPVLIAPAMDLDMWHHASTQRNISLLKTDGCHQIPVGYGELASGLVGEGRMAEPEDIVDALNALFQEQKSLSGLRALVTAGPTHEAIDPVRYIGNHSTGKMGIAIANALLGRGADVDLILGPTSLKADPGVNTIQVRSAADMFTESEKHFGGSTIAVFAAAVADYKPTRVAMEKMKKSDKSLSMLLTRTQDIAKTLGEKKLDHQITVGFALETESPIENAQKKLRSKHFDFVVLNSLRDPGAGFGHDTNKVSFIFPGNNTQQFKLKSKQEVASDIVDAIVKLVNAKTRE